jgi:hypothetical protein
MKYKVTKAFEAWRKSGARTRCHVDVGEILTDPLGVVTGPRVTFARERDEPTDSCEVDGDVFRNSTEPVSEEPE